MTIFTSPLRYWQVSWPAPAIVALAPRAAGELPGTLYFLNPDTGVLARVFDETLGLTTLVNPAGTKVLYGQGLSALKLYSIRDRATKSFIIATLPEKCVWASDSITIYCAAPNLPAAAQYPDDWWSGETTFIDNLWRVNTDTGEARIIWSNRPGNSFDAINLILDEADKRLIFTDRWSATLWSLDLRS